MWNFYINIVVLKGMIILFYIFLTIQKVSIIDELEGKSPDELTQIIRSYHLSITENLDKALNCFKDSPEKEMIQKILNKHKGISIESFLSETKPTLFIDGLTRHLNDTLTQIDEIRGKLRESPTIYIDNPNGFLENIISIIGNESLSLAQYQCSIE